MGFNRYTGSNITGSTDVLTCPASTIITVIGATVANVSGTTTTATVQAAGANILKDVTIYGGSAIVPVGGEQKVVLVAGDTFNVTADAGVDVIVSVLETTV